MPKNTISVNGGAMSEAHLGGLAGQQARRRKNIKTLQRLRREARDEIHRLIGFLDASDEYVLTELEDDDTREDVGDDEPSLGSFDRMVDQEKSWRQEGEWANCNDLEQDDCDHEPSLAALENHVVPAPPGVCLIPASSSAPAAISPAGPAATATTAKTIRPRVASLTKMDLREQVGQVL